MELFKELYLIFVPILIEYFKDSSQIPYKRSLRCFDFGFMKNFNFLDLKNSFLD